MTHMLSQKPGLPRGISALPLWSGSFSVFSYARRVLFAVGLILLLALAGGCAGKQGGEAGKTPVSAPVMSAPAGKTSAFGQTSGAVSAQGVASTQAPAQTGPHSQAEAPGKAAGQSGEPTGGTGKTAGQAGDQTAAKAGAKAPVKPPVLEQLLASTGRDAAAHQAEPGFVLRVPNRVWAGEPFLIQAGGQGLKKVTAVWRDKTVSTQPGADGQAAGEAVLMLSVLQKQPEKSLPVALTLEWDSGKVETMRADIPVSKRTHPVQRLRVEQKYVTPDPALDEKIKQDQREVRETISKISPVRYWHTPFLRPVPGEVTSIYGLRRVFNGEERNPHRGIDFDAKQGDPIQACDDGIVVLVSDHYYGGQTVIVDHGLGVFSLYLHLSGFNVHPGQAVKRGDVVGFIGSTGRVTGPHLHLSLAVLGEMVDAAPCITGMGKL